MLVIIACLLFLILLSTETGRAFVGLIFRGTVMLSVVLIGAVAIGLLFLGANP